MSGIYDEWLDSVRADARKEVAEKLKAQVAGRREAEKLRRKAGRGNAYSFLSAKQIQKIRQDPHVLREMSSDPDFRKLLEERENEESTWREEIREGENRAAQRALMAIPAEVRVARDHASQRNLFLSQHGLISEDEIETAPDAVKADFSELINVQKKEVEAISRGSPAGRVAGQRVSGDTGSRPGSGESAGGE